MTLFVTKAPSKARLDMRKIIDLQDLAWDLNKVKTPRPLPIWTPDPSGLAGQAPLQYFPVGWRFLLREEQRLGWIDLQKSQIGLGVQQSGGQEQAERLVGRLLELEQSEWAASEVKYEVRILAIRYLHLSAIWLVASGSTSSEQVLPLNASDRSPIGLNRWENMVKGAAVKRQVDPAKQLRVGA